MLKYRREKGGSGGPDALPLGEGMVRGPVRSGGGGMTRKRSTAAGARAWQWWVTWHGRHE
jgi:hypothetical protein